MNNLKKAILLLSIVICTQAAISMVLQPAPEKLIAKETCPPSLKFLSTIALKQDNVQIKTLPSELQNYVEDLNLILQTKKLIIRRAITRGNYNLIPDLIAFGVDVNDSECHAYDGSYSNALLEAARYNKIEVLQILLEHGAELDKGGFYCGCDCIWCPDHNLTAVQIALRKGYKECANLLVQYGAHDV